MDLAFAGAIVKTASRCNLNCSYCYMYNLGDSTWKGQPGVMQPATIRALIERVAEHCDAHEMSSFEFGFHGGEPLLMPKDQLRYFVETARATLEPSVKVVFRIQTNGTLLSPGWCDQLLALDVQVGVSLDGPERVNDRFRLDRHGRGSYRSVRAGLDNAARAGLDVGILVVIDPTSDPDEAFDHLVSVNPRAVDLLLPEATHDEPPSHLPSVGDDQTVYADWMLRFFDRWSTLDPAPFRVRRFDQIIGTLLGQLPPRDRPGANRNRVVVVETDGGIEPVDVLRVCEAGMTRTDLNVSSHPLDAAFDNELVRHYYASFDRPCDTCARCSLRAICGGGYLPHRYSEHNGFDNPSVYCADLQALIRGIQSWTFAQLPAALLARAGIGVDN